MVLHVNFEEKSLQSLLTHTKIYNKKKMLYTLTLWRPKWPDLGSILLCLTSDDFTRQWGTPGSQWVNEM